MKIRALALLITAVVPVQADIINAKAIKLVSPVYPASAVASGLEGAVIVCFNIDADGHAVDPVVLSSTSEIFDQVALDAIAGSTFAPAGGDDSGAETCWRYRFRL